MKRARTKPSPIQAPVGSPVGNPVRQAHEYIRNGTAKMLTLFHPRAGAVRIQGVTSATNAVLHPWLKEQCAAILEPCRPQPPLMRRRRPPCGNAGSKACSSRSPCPSVAAVAHAAGVG